MRRPAGVVQVCPVVRFRSRTPEKTRRLILSGVTGGTVPPVHREGRNQLVRWLVAGGAGMTGEPGCMGRARPEICPAAEPGVERRAFRMRP